MSTARDKITAKAAKRGWSITEHSSSMLLRKDGVTIALRFGGNRRGEGIEAASWNLHALSGAHKLAQVLRALDS